MLVWAGDSESALSSVSVPTFPPEGQDRAPASYTPRYLAEKILASRRALEGERKHVMVLSGLVVVGSIGDNLRMDYSAIGDTTHLASRLQQHAEPDGILVSASTSRQGQGYVRLVAGAGRGEGQNAAGLNL